MEDLAAEVGVISSRLARRYVENFTKRFSNLHKRLNFITSRNPESTFGMFFYRLTFFITSSYFDLCLTFWTQSNSHAAMVPHATLLSTEIGEPRYNTFFNVYHAKSYHISVY